jgi:hypothetical protein
MFIYTHYIYLHTDRQTFIRRYINKHIRDIRAYISYTSKQCAVNPKDTHKRATIEHPSLPVHMRATKKKSEGFRKPLYTSREWRGKEGDDGTEG